MWPTLQLSTALKKITPQKVCNSTIANVCAADVRKKTSDPLIRPIVAGPTASAKIFTRANRPLMIPKPRPETYARICLFSVTRTLSATSWRPFSVFRSIL